MITHHLLRMSLGNLAVRYGRSLFLVLGVAVGTGTLAFLIATYIGLDSLVRTNLDAYREVFAQRFHGNRLPESVPMAGLAFEADAHARSVAVDQRNANVSERDE